MTPPHPPKRPPEPVPAQRTALGEAQRWLALCIGREHEAGRAANRADRAIAEALQAAMGAEGGDALVEDLAAWLPDARQRAAHARAALELLQAETARARAQLAACRTAQKLAQAPPPQPAPLPSRSGP